MQKKLTLSLDDELIKKAKTIARRREKSLSRLVAEYFTVLTTKEKDTSELPPLVKSLYGSLSDVNINETDYKKFIQTKHL